LESLKPEKREKEKNPKAKIAGNYLKVYLERMIRANQKGR
jgi:hypothetical protein